MQEQFLISSFIDGRVANVKEMVSEFHLLDQNNSAFNPLFRFSGDALLSRNVVGFLVSLKEIHPVAVFDTIFPKDALDSSLSVNSILNYMNAYPKAPNQFLMRIACTDEKKRKTLFDGQALGLSDISKMFTKQPIGQNKPILEIDPEFETDAHKLLSMFPPGRFSFSILPTVPDAAQKLTKELESVGYAPFVPVDISESGETMSLF